MAEKLPTNTIPVNSGNDTHSYSSNSFFQGKIANFLKDKIKEEIIKNLDVQSLSCHSNTISVTDLGCATGPNTFISIQNILDAIKHKHQIQCPNSTKTPQFQVFFNDIESNDFNTLFTSLPPERPYFVAGVPGSFYDQLFPESSIAIAFTSFCLNWLSKLPPDLQEENSPAWNKGKVHYCYAPRKEVHEAYKIQFANDMELFWDARANELLPGAMLVIVGVGIPHGVPLSNTGTGLMYEALESVLLDMVEEGLIRESQVDSFNLPYYFASPEEMMEGIDKNRCFTTEHIELLDLTSGFNGLLDIRSSVAHFRAIIEGLIKRHFGSKIVDDVFERLIQQYSKDYDKRRSLLSEKTILLAVLKRKEGQFNEKA